VALSEFERERYRRHLVLPEVGEEGQRRLKSARVLVIGAGGLGSPSALYLAASGIGTLGLVDADRVDLTNLQRQVLFDTSSIARSKVEIARERLSALNPEIRVVAHDLELKAANVAAVFRDYDVVLDGTDRLATRYLVNDACVLLGTPLVSAAIHRFEGQAMTYVPGRGPCYRCLFPELSAEAIPNCAEAGVLGVLPGVLGCIQATEAIKLVLGVGEPLVGRLLTYDALEMRFEEFRFSRRADCAVCGDRPTITSLRDPLPGVDMSQVDAIQRITPVELQQLLDGQRDPAHPDVVLVDVREPAEFAAGHIAGALHVPVGQLAARLDEIPGDRTPVFICRSGGRSMNACGIALRAGRDAVVNLEGGMLAWSATVDPTIRVG
jgi:molybdopterin/thiamine biosynthesis adenylyltransferase/rhodanese-related sulfurtransferase